MVRRRTGALRLAKARALRREKARAVERARIGPLGIARTGALKRARTVPLGRVRTGPLERARTGPLERAVAKVGREKTRKYGRAKARVLLERRRLDTWKAWSTGISAEPLGRAKTGSLARLKHWVRQSLEHSEVLNAWGWMWLKCLKVKSCNMRKGIKRSEHTKGQAMGSERTGELLGVDKGLRFYKYLFYISVIY